MTARALLGAIVACLTACHASAQPPEVLSGKIAEVTVYQGTALVSRVVELPAAPAAAMEVVVSDLPSATDPNSVYADQAQGVEIRSVAFRTKAPREVVAKEEARLATNFGRLV